MTRQTQGLIAINIAAIIFGSAALFGKLNVSPFWIVCMRAMFASVALLIIALSKNQLIKPRRNLISLVFTGIILSLHWLTFFFSVQLSGIAVATLTFAAFPLFTLLIDSFRAKRNMKWVEVAAGLMIIVAVALLVRVDTASASLLFGASLGIASALLFAVFGIISKRLTSLLPTLSVSCFQNIVVCLVLLPLLPASLPPHGNDWLFLLLLGIVTTALMHQLYFYALQRLSAGTCSGFVALEPVYAIIFAAVLFREPVSVSVVISGLLILAASYMIMKS